MISPQLEVTQPLDNRRFVVILQANEDDTPVSFRASVPGFVERLQNVAFITVSLTGFITNPALPFTPAYFVTLGGLLDSNYNQSTGFTYLKMVPYGQPAFFDHSDYSLANTSINIDAIDVQVKDYGGNIITIDTDETIIFEFEVTYYYVQPVAYLTY